MKIWDNSIYGHPTHTRRVLHFTGALYGRDYSTDAFFNAALYSTAPLKRFRMGFLLDFPVLSCLERKLMLLSWGWCLLTHSFEWPVLGLDTLWTARDAAAVWMGRRAAQLCSWPWHHRRRSSVELLLSRSLLGFLSIANIPQQFSY